MLEFFINYGLFFLKTLTIVIACIVIIGVFASSKAKVQDKTLKIKKINEQYADIKMQMLSAVCEKKEFNEKTKIEKKQLKQTDADKPKLFVIEFEGDISASESETLKDEITAVMSIAEPRDEILLKLDNSGGLVHEHGFASSQLERIKTANLALTISVDKVAASGGYMMACIADKIIAAPFAILGSIGVLAEMPNFNRLLDKVGIDYEQHTAGEFKRNITMFGKNSDKEREKLKLDLQQTHALFREFVEKHRPRLDVERVATGEIWYGKQALELKLIDEIKTSDEFIINALDVFDVFAVEIEVKKNLSDKFLGGMFSLIEGLKNKYASEKSQSRFY